MDQAYSRKDQAQSGNTTVNTYLVCVDKCGVGELTFKFEHQDVTLERTYPLQIGDCELCPLWAIIILSILLALLVIFWIYFILYGLITKWGPERYRRDSSTYGKTYFDSFYLCCLIVIPMPLELITLIKIVRSPNYLKSFPRYNSCIGATQSPCLEHYSSCFCNCSIQCLWCLMPSSHYTLVATCCARVGNIADFRVAVRNRENDSKILEEARNESNNYKSDKLLRAFKHTAYKRKTYSSGPRPRNDSQSLQASFKV